MRISPAILLSCIALAISCSDKHEVTASQEILIPNELIGKWDIIQYTDSGIDKTAVMTGIELQFNASGSLSAFASDSLVDGVWNIISDIGLDKVSMQLNSYSHPYDILSASWFVFSKSNGALSLSHTSPVRSQILVMERQ